MAKVKFDNSHTEVVTQATLMRKTTIFEIPKSENSEPRSCQTVINEQWCMVGECNTDYSLLIDRLQFLLATI
jgi:hypothetical protein